MEIQERETSSGRRTMGEVLRGRMCQACGRGLRRKMKMDLALKRRGSCGKGLEVKGEIFKDQKNMFKC